VARALFGGAPNVERVDRLVQSIAAQQVRKTPSWPRSWANFSLF
jgi:hypothetical protein